MISCRFFLLAGASLGVFLSTSALNPADAHAQMTPQNPLPARTPTSASKPTDDEQAADGADTVAEVVVSARSNDIRTSIDAVSYSLADDLQSATGTLTDALRNLPSVDVDPQGGVSLRGDSGVTILVDGRPSALFTGEGRGQAILTLPSAPYARIEVMTNPSAAYSPEGSGGVINLITKPTPRRTATNSSGSSGAATRTGSLNAAVGDDGRYNIGLNGAWTRDRLTLAADAGLRHDSVTQEVRRLRERLDAGSGLFLPARQDQTSDGTSDNAFVRVSADYRLDDRTQLFGELRYTDLETRNRTTETYRSDNASGAATSAYSRASDGGYGSEMLAATGRVIRRFDDQGHEWSTDLRLYRVRGGIGAIAETRPSAPAGDPVHETVELINDVDQLGLTSAWVKPLRNGGKVRAGYELELVRLVLDNRVRRGPSPTALVPDPRVSNDYHVDQAVHAVYATWEQPLAARLSGQFGLRLERADRELDQVTSGVEISNGYSRAYPTLHLSYQLSDAQTLRASFSQRVQRPRPSELNPFLTYQDPVNYRSGNPDLQPQDTASWEMMWQRRVAQTLYQATLYHRDTEGAVTQVTSDMGSGVFLTRPENLGSRTTSGLELVATGRLLPTLRYNVSANLYRQDIDASGLAGARSASGDVVSGRLNLNWEPTSSDFVQLSTLWSGDQIEAQGSREAAALVNLGYRRKLRPDLAFNLTVRDLTNEGGETIRLDTPEFRDRTERLVQGRAAFVGLTWTFGGTSRRPQDPTFDFSAAPTGG
jgi:outer membrane receptor protein involved in Fe transport